MSRRQGPSEVRGPTSALTAFLKSKNIRVENANRFRRRDAGEDPVLASPSPVTTAEPNGVARTPVSASPTPGPSTSSAAQPRRSRNMPSKASNASMQFDEDDASEDDMYHEEKSSKKRAAEASTSSSTLTIGQKRAKASGEQAESSQAATTTARRSVSYRNTQAGAIDFCPMCENRFCITAYTKHTPEGGLCHKCGPKYVAGSQGGRPSTSKENGFHETDDYVPDVPAVKKKSGRAKFKTLHDFNALPTLQSLCINIVSNNIEDVEALIGIGGQNMNKISKSISKNRRLNSQTVQLFLQPQAKKLAFYDCSQLDSDALASIATFSPDVESINLQLCGMLDNATLDTWGQKLKQLHQIELYGCYLVRVEAWHRFFETMKGRLTSFKIRESPRFDKGCCESLVKNCPNVTEVGLAQIGPLDKTCLKLIEQYGHQLTYLDISDPGVSAPGVPAKSLEDDEVISLLKETGRKLSYLNLSRNADLTSRTLLKGVLENCKSLNALYLTLCSAEDVKGENATADEHSMRAQDFVTLFEGLKKRGCATLTHISLERCLAVDDSVIKALVDFSGRSLVDININSCDAVTSEGFQIIAKGCPNLEKIDVGFCRQINDASVMDLISNNTVLKEIWLFSCNKVSDYLHSDRVKIIGKEKYARANIPLPAIAA